MLWQHNANPSYKLASIPRYDDIVRTAGWAGSALAARRRPAADGGRSQHYCGSLDCGLPLVASGNKKRTHSVSEYMLVLALCFSEHCLSESSVFVASVSVVSISF